MFKCLQPNKSNSSVQTSLQSHKIAITSTAKPAIVRPYLVNKKLASRHSFSNIGGY